MSFSTKFPSDAASNAFIKYISVDEIKGITESLGHTLSKKYEGQEVYVVANLKGSFIFLADLVRNMKNVKVFIDFLNVKSIGRSRECNGSISLTKDISLNLLDKNVLIVEEIIDTGRALQFIYDRIKLAQPSNIEVVTLFDKPYKRAVPIQADYVGKKIDDQFIVGHGLDLEEYGRNLKDIYFLRYPN